MLIVAQDILGSPVVEHGKGRTMQGNLVQLLSETFTGTLTTDPLEPNAKRFRYSLCF